MFRAALPDWHSDVDQLIAEGDIVVEQFTASGTHRGELMGVPGTGGTIVLRGINIFRIADDRIVERGAGSTNSGCSSSSASRRRDRATTTRVGLESFGRVFGLNLRAPDVGYRPGIHTVTTRHPIPPPLT